MRQNDTIRKLIRKDCRKAMWLPVVILATYQFLTGVMTIFMSDGLGDLTNAVLAVDLSKGLTSLPTVLTYLGVSVIVLPFLGLLGYVLMLKQALKHDGIVIGRFLDKTYESVRTIDKGEAEERLGNDANDLRIEWSSVMEKAIYSPLVLLLVLIYSIRLSFTFTIIVCAITLLKLIVPFLVKNAEKQYDAENKAYSIRAKTLEGEFNQRPYIARLFGLIEPFIKKYDKDYCEYYHTSFANYVRCKTFADTTLSFLDTFCILLILIFGAWFVTIGEISAGAVASMVVYSSIYNTIISNIAYIIRNAPLLHNRINRVELLYANPETLTGQDIHYVTEITANELFYTYSDRPVISGLSFTFHRGTKIAICGENGSGKSTLLSILCGLNKQYQGSLCLNKIELRDCSIVEWREQFAFVEQEPYLFSGTIRENIRIGNLSTTDVQLDAVIHEVGIDSIVNKEVSLNQNTLSGGEKQKISIARALLKNAHFLIMDEPTNNLDIQTQKWLYNFIQNYGGSIIFITHDHTFAKLADQVIYLKKQ